jgi:aryl-alcohol dehydrogenase-like predicted oxidoreductase
MLTHVAQTLPARQLGDSRIQVTVAGLGCNNFGMRTDAAASIQVVHAALDLGINFFDTADVYGGRESERYLGAALKGRRDQAVVLTKFGMPADPDHPEHRGASPEHIRRSIEGSLRRLEMDYVDVYMLHRPDPTSRWRPPSRPSTGWSRRARCARSRAPTSPAGRWPTPTGRLGPADCGT